MLSLQSSLNYILHKELKDINVTPKTFFLKCYLAVLYAPPSPERL